MKLADSVQQLKNGFNQMTSLFKSGDKFLVVEILNHQIKVTAIRADFNKKLFYFLKSRRRPLTPADYNYDNLCTHLEKLLKPFGRLNQFQIILNLDPRLATTIHSGVSLVRHNAKEPIDDADLDNLISRAIWGFFDRYRPRAASKMGINDTDVVLSDIQVNGIRLDDHRVVNPIGFPARSVELQLSLTFTIRDFINHLKGILPREKIVFISEDGSALLQLLTSASGGESAVLANLFPEATMMFSARDNSLGYLDKLNWGKINFSKALIAGLAVKATTAERIWHRYLAGDLSPTFARKLDSLFSEELQILVNGLERALDKTKAKQLYLNPFFALPPVILAGSFKNKFTSAIKLVYLNNDLISKKFNYEIKLRDAVSDGNDLATLAGILVEWATTRNDNVIKMAKRRIRWLI